MITGENTKPKAVEIFFWSIAFPGFGQFLNGKLFKGTVLLVLEFIININAKMNVVIMASFHGDIQKAVQMTNYQWLMFYPCVYLFAVWDAYRDAGGGQASLASLPFVFAAYLGTVGVIYSPTLTVWGILLGPIWLGLASMIIGFLTGEVVRVILLKSKVRFKLP